MMGTRGQMIWRKQHNPYRALCANQHLSPVMYCVCAGGGDEDGFEDDGDENADGLDDAAAAAAKGQKQKGGRARQGGSADEEATLTTPNHLRAKKGDQTFAVDPLFHTMSALFDEGGAKGECVCVPVCVCVCGGGGG